MPGRKRMRTGKPAYRPMGPARRPAGWSTRSRASGLKSRNALVRVPRNKLGFPQEMSTTLRYVQTKIVDPGNATAHGFTIRANGMYDPDFSIGGQQPRGFDQYMELYDKFTVTSAKLSVTFAYRGYLGPPPGSVDATGAPVQQIDNTGDTVTAPSAVICLVHKAVNENDAQTIFQFQEHDRTKWTTITPQGEARTVSTSLTSREFFGKDFIVGADGYTGSATADPSNQLYFHIMAGRLDDSADKAIQIMCNCIVEYKCTFTEPKQLAQS